MAERLLTVGDVARITGWHVLTVYGKARRGEIPGMLRLEPKRNIRFKAAEIDRWLKRSEVKLKDKKKEIKV